MISNVDKLLEFIDENGLTQFQVRTAPDKDAFLFKSRDNESVAEAKERLKRVLEGAGLEKYYFEGSEKAGSTKGWFRTYFLTGQPQYNATAAQISGTPHVSQEDIDDKIEQGVKRALERRELEELRSENKELRKEIEGYEENRETLKVGALQQLTPYLGAILSKLMPQPTQVAVAGLTADNPCNDRLTEVINRLSLLDPDYLLILEMLADIGEKNPAMIGVAKTTLSNFHKSM